MTRKRFKKLLMAKGISRNGAEALAYHVKIRKCRSYEEMLEDSLYARKAAGATLAEISAATGQAIQRLSAAVERLGEAFIAAAEAFENHLLYGSN